MDELSDPVEERYQALWALVDDEGATLPNVAAQPSLLNLARVSASLPDDVAEDDLVRAELARDEIVAACRDLQAGELQVEARHYDPGDACLIALGLATGYRGLPLRRRRSAVADKLGLAADTAWKERPEVRSHVQAAVYALADQLVAREAAFRRRHAAHRSEEERPALSAMGAEMMRRYEVYYNMYTALRGLRGNITAVLQIRAEGEDELNKLGDYVGLSLYDYADFLSHKERHLRELGGIWLFGQGDVEQAVADAIKLIEHFSPLTYRQESVARLGRAEHGEVHSFLTGLEQDAHGPLLLRNWRQRLLSCECDLVHPQPAYCKVHGLLHACAFWTQVLDIDWYRSVPWHGEPPANLGAIDVTALYRELGLNQDR